MLRADTLAGSTAAMPTNQQNDRSNLSRDNNKKKIQGDQHQDEFLPDVASRTFFKGIPTGTADPGVWASSPQRVQKKGKLITLTSTVQYAVDLRLVEQLRVLRLCRLELDGHLLVEKINKQQRAVSNVNGHDYKTTVL